MSSKNPYSRSSTEEATYQKYVWPASDDPTQNILKKNSG